MNTAHTKNALLWMTTKKQWSKDMIWKRNKTDEWLHLIAAPRKHSRLKQSYLYRPIITYRQSIRPLIFHITLNIGLRTLVSPFLILYISKCATKL